MGPLPSKPSRAPSPARPIQPSSVYRPPTPPKLLSDKPWRNLSMSGAALEQKIKDDIEKLNPEKTPNILLLGPAGAGKSSFINSCLSLSAGRKKSVANTGSAATSYSLFLKVYKDRGMLKKFRLLDSMGIEPNHEEGFHTRDVVFLLKGHVKKNYKFNPKQEMSVCCEFYRKKPKLEHTAHCVVFVLDARTVHIGIPANYVVKIKILQDEIKNEGVPRVLILTHVDMLCDKVGEDASNIFKSLKLQEAMKIASELFGIEMASIHPVINYEAEFEVTCAINIPILLALRQMMEYASDRIEHVLDESASEEDEDSD